MASAVTAYGRMIINGYKHIPDSVILKNELDPAKVGKALGQVKLEMVIKDGYFLNPKVYAIRKYPKREMAESPESPESPEEDYYVKMKGIPRDRYKANPQDKFFIKFEAESIKKDTRNFTLSSYLAKKTLKLSSNKRNYFSWGDNIRPVETYPVLIWNNEVIDKTKGIDFYQFLELFEALEGIMPPVANKSVTGINPSLTVHATLGKRSFHSSAQNFKTPKENQARKNLKREEIKKTQIQFSLEAFKQYWPH
ncbi:hypothetical protein HK100_009024 [Physocladia obscura]|uniref:Uncharacterized protein n=1 Tax=Physocladia obscura TaxID=109957 RepID=A0AAD5T5F7_9FUNG|nr:hypothetical protein HK100_009024 [Physocladia obscura]